MNCGGTAQRQQRPGTGSAESGDPGRTGCDPIFPAPIPGGCIRPGGSRRFWHERTTVMIDHLDKAEPELFSPLIASRLTDCLTTGRSFRAELEGFRHCRRMRSAASPRPSWISWPAVPASCSETPIPSSPAWRTSRRASQRPGAPPAAVPGTGVYPFPGTQWIEGSHPLPIVRLQRPASGCPDRGGNRRYPG